MVNVSLNNEYAWNMHFMLSNEGNKRKSNKRKPRTRGRRLIVKTESKKKNEMCFYIFQGRNGDLLQEF